MSQTSAKSHQRRWAEQRRQSVDDRGYLAEYELNLYRRLTDATRRAFQRGRGSELAASGSHPAKMRALHSSAALVANVFDFWCDRDASPLAAALGIEDRVTDVQIEVPLRSGLRGSAPHLDVLLRLADGSTVGIESKFTEWLSPARADRTPFRDAYFADGRRLWASRGLTECQRLAAGIHEGAIRYRHLDAAQLLKHVLGLSWEGTAFRLFYLYYAEPGEAGSVHREEIEHFTAGVGSEVGFRAFTYGDLISRLAALPSPDTQGYLEYVVSRYGGG
jgi:hypothetical protein